MKNPRTLLMRSALCSTTLAALSWTFAFTLAQAPAGRAAPGLRTLADKAPNLPLNPTFKKVPDGEDGPYVLSLENVSKDTLKVSARIFPSVVFHANAKVRDLPEHAIEPGQSWSIPGLASTDKLTLTAEGFAPLEITVP